MNPDLAKKNINATLNNCFSRSILLYTVAGLQGIDALSLTFTSYATYFLMSFVLTLVLYLRSGVQPYYAIVSSVVICSAATASVALAAVVGSIVLLVILRRKHSFVRVLNILTFSLSHFIAASWPAMAMSVLFLKYTEEGLKFSTEEIAFSVEDDNNMAFLVLFSAFIVSVSVMLFIILVSDNTIKLESEGVVDRTTRDEKSASSSLA